MRPIMMGVSLTVLLVGMTGCQSMTYSLNPAKGVSSGSGTGTPVSTFQESRTAHYLFWGLAPVHRPDINEIAAASLQPGQVLTDLKVEEQNSFANGFLAAITYGIYRPRRIEFTGQVRKNEEAR